MHRAFPRILYAALALTALELVLGGILLTERIRHEARVPPVFLASLLLSALILGLLLLLLRRSLRLEAARGLALRESIDEAILALGETHQILLSTFESMGDGFMSLDTRWRCTYVNRKAGELLGRAPAELLGRVLWEVFPGGVGPSLRQTYEQAMQDRVPRVVEQHDGTLDRWFESRISPFPGGIAIFFQEITERRRSEEALRRSEKRFRSLVQASAQIVWTRLPGGWTEEDSPSWRAYTGQSEAAYLGEGWLDAIHPEDQEAVREAWAGAARTGRYEAAYRLRGVDGVHRLFLARGVPLVDAQGAVQGWVGTNQDITERRRAEELQAGQTRILKMVAEGAELEDILAALDLFIQEQSGRALCSVVLLDPGGRRISVCVAPGLPPAYNHALAGLEIGPSSGSCGTAMHRGTPVLVEDLETDPLWAEYRHMALPHGLRACSSWPIRGSEGQVLGSFAMYFREPALPDGLEQRLVAISTDLAGLAIERRLAEERIQTLNAELEQRVQLRTAQLQEANQEMEAFSYSVSHDLKAPLRAVTGFAEILVGRHAGSLNEQGRQYLQNILEASQRMARLIEDLLAYARLGREAISPVTVELREILEPLAASLEPRLATAAATIEWPTHPPKVLGQRSLLFQVLSNLIDNALAYGRPEEPVRVRIEALAAGGLVELRVHDNGQGIPAEHHDKIFRVFQRLHGDETPGTGIGLAMVHKAVSMMGGDMRVESSPGHGSTFVVTLLAG